MYAGSRAKRNEVTPTFLKDDFIDPLPSLTLSLRGGVDAVGSRDCIEGGRVGRVAIVGDRALLE